MTDMKGTKLQMISNNFNTALEYRQYFISISKVLI